MHGLDALSDGHKSTWLGYDLESRSGVWNILSAAIFQPAFGVETLAVVVW